MVLLRSRFLTKDHLLGILRTLTTQFAEMKLVVNLNKCKLWRPGEVTPQADVSQINSDIRVLGTPFGESRSTLDSSVAALGRIWEKLPTLEDCQIAICLLRSCLGCCKVNHLFRTLPLGSHDPFCLRHNLEFFLVIYGSVILKNLI